MHQWIADLVYLTAERKSTLALKKLNTISVQWPIGLYIKKNHLYGAFKTRLGKLASFPTKDLENLLSSLIDTELFNRHKRFKCFKIFFFWSYTIYIKKPSENFKRNGLLEATVYIITRVQRNVDLVCTYLWIAYFHEV